MSRVKKSLRKRWMGVDIPEEIYNSKSPFEFRRKLAYVAGYYDEQRMRIGGLNLLDAFRRENGIGISREAIGDVFEGSLIENKIFDGRVSHYVLIKRNSRLVPKEEYRDFYEIGAADYIKHQEKN